MGFSQTDSSFFFGGYFQDPMPDTIYFNPYDWVYFKILFTYPVTNSDSIKEVKITVKSLEKINGEYFNNTFIDTFIVKNDSAINSYRNLFSQEGDYEGVWYFIKAEYGTLEDSVIVHYSRIDLYIAPRHFPKSVDNKTKNIYNLNGAKFRHNSKYLKVFK